MNERTFFDFWAAVDWFVQADVPYFDALQEDQAGRWIRDN
jgi:hypothetical protein